MLVSYPDPLPPAILFGREGGSGKTGTAFLAALHGFW